MAYADGLKKGELHREQFTFIKIDNGNIINFFSDLNNLKEILGEAAIGASSDLFIPLVWDGLILKVLPDRYTIRIITVENSQFATIEGLKIGDNAELVEKIYGEPFIKRSTIYTYFYFDTEDVWNLLFYFNSNNKIEKMVILRGD
jgi:hypothetical protein